MPDPTVPPGCLTRSEGETEGLAAALASELEPGAVVLLSGGLGAGKTAFVRGLARGLGIEPGEVSSPTFGLVHEHAGGRLPLFHADLYRLSQVEAADVGLDDERMTSGVLAVEWPERLSRDVPGALRVRFEILDETSRQLTFDGPWPARPHSIR
ncbi:MAG: tRNA (adenosine(37)-N6)-threonylcarbamoyltransferase complex ATPase subunit type 1 TsaE [Acidobacteria bacterium]|nr:tRNA (adenosine(37)-N6)-threonylcarbamoyltransferase complex ATPase subunit type 1 TsaE [Acidobacteriota bacterium]